MKVTLIPLGKRLVFPDGHVEEGYEVKMSNTKIEQVARAIAEANNTPTALDAYSLARAAIAAMREPTEAMLMESSCNAVETERLVRDWQAMIDAALEEK